MKDKVDLIIERAEVKIGILNKLKDRRSKLDKLKNNHIYNSHFLKHELSSVAIKALKLKIEEYDIMIDKDDKKIVDLLNSISETDL